MDACPRHVTLAPKHCTVGSHSMLSQQRSILHCRFSLSDEEKKTQLWKNHLSNTLLLRGDFFLKQHKTKNIQLVLYLYYYA